MIKLFWADGESVLNGTERIFTAGLGIEQDGELLPSGEMLGVAVGAKAGDDVFEIMSPEKVEQLV